MSKFKLNCAVYYDYINTNYNYREEYTDVQKYEIYFECWPGYLTSEQSEQVRYPVEHEK